MNLLTRPMVTLYLGVFLVVLGTYAREGGKGLFLDIVGVVLIFFGGLAAIVVYYGDQNSQ